MQRAGGTGLPILFGPVSSSDSCVGFPQFGPLPSFHCLQPTNFKRRGDDINSPIFKASSQRFIMIRFTTDGPRRCAKIAQSQATGASCGTFELKVCGQTSINHCQNERHKTYHTNVPYLIALLASKQNEPVQGGKRLHGSF